MAVNRSQGADTVFFGGFRKLFKSSDIWYNKIGSVCPSKNGNSFRQGLEILRESRPAPSGSASS